MNYYRRYIGDFQRDTGHLSLVEVGTYDRLLDHYYATERELPVSIDVLCRIARAISKDEQAAVKSVVEQFFPLNGQGRRNKRADHEIAVARKARDNGEKGGRPKTGTITESITGSVTGSVTETITGSVHPPTTNHQPPNHHPTSLQPPPTNHGSKALARATRLPENFSVPTAWIGWAQGEQPSWTPDYAGREAEKFKDYWISKGGKDGRKMDWQATWRNWVRNAKPMKAYGASVADRNDQAAEEWLKSGSIPGEAKRVKSTKP